MEKHTIEMPPWPSGKQVRQEFLKKCPKVMMSFSCGKDAIAATQALIEDGFDFDLFYFYLVPDLEFVEESLVYFEQKFGKKLHRLPSPELYRMLANYVLQPPERWRTIAACNFQEITRDQLRDALAQELGYETPWTASGVRACDNMARRTKFKLTGPITESRLMWYPIWDSKKDGVVELIRRGGYKMPVDYQMFGRSFDGIHYQYLSKIKRYFPRDYNTILEWFPMAELEMKREEYSHV